MSHILFLFLRRTLDYGCVTVVELEELLFDFCIQVYFQLVFLYHSLLLGLYESHFIKLLNKTSLSYLSINKQNI